METFPKSLSRPQSSAASITLEFFPRVNFLSFKYYLLKISEIPSLKCSVSNLRQPNLSDIRALLKQTLCSLAQYTINKEKLSMTDENKLFDWCHKRLNVRCPALALAVDSHCQGYFLIPFILNLFLVTCINRRACLLSLVRAQHLND